MRHFITVVLMLFVCSLMAQTPYSITSSSAVDPYTIEHSDDAGVEQISLANPWFGAKLSYSLNEDAPLDDNFLFSAKVLHTPISGERYAVPIVASAGLGSSDLLNPESGVNVGIYPYYFLSSTSKFNLVLHGGIGYKVVTKDVPAEVETPQQIRLVGGLEAAFFPESGGLPTTLSVTPVYLYHTQEAVESTAALEVTGILPIAKGLGLLAEGQIPFSGSFDGSFRFGVIVNGQL